VLPVVLLHPIGLDSRTWQFVDISFIPSAVVHDFPGHRGRVADAPADLDAFADDLVRRNPGCLHLAGVSMGGAVALHAALRHPDRVASIALVAAGAGSADGSVLDARADAVERDGIEGVLDETLDRWFDGYAEGAPDAVDYARATLLAQDAGWFAGCWRALARHDVAGRLREIDVPVTVVHPVRDAATLESKEALAASLPHGRLLVIDGPHMVQLARPADFAGALKEHLEWAQAGSTST
jgi:3-oxoadipate enol-lactonase